MPWSRGLAKEYVDQLRQFTGIHLDHRRSWPAASSACRHKGCTKSFQRQDLHLVSTTILALHREHIGRGDKEQLVMVVRLREEPCQFRFKLAWSHRLQGARIAPAAHLPCTPYVSDIRNRV